MRIESDKPTRNGGWLHLSDDPVRYIPPPKKAIEDRPLDAHAIWRGWVSTTDAIHLDGFAMSLGVDTDSLRAIGCAWSGQAWAFPMYDAMDKVIGIRLRNDQGQKWAVKGSHQGLFLSERNGPRDKMVFIVEGPTDLAAALTLGLPAIGRPACLGQEQIIIEWIREERIRRAVIVTDNDEPGLRGAAKLQGLLPIPNCLWIPPAKDIREFLCLGGDRDMIEASIKDTVWTSQARRAA